MRLRYLLPRVLTVSLSGLCAAGRNAVVQTMTDVGTLRAKTLIVEHLNCRIGNPARINFYQEGTTDGDCLRRMPVRSCGTRSPATTFRRLRSAPTSTRCMTRTAYGCFGSAARTGCDLNMEALLAQARAVGDPSSHALIYRQVVD
jgi:hypothetical protein